MTFSLDYHIPSYIGGYGYFDIFRNSLFTGPEDIPYLIKVRYPSYYCDTFREFPFDRALSINRTLDEISVYIPYPQASHTMYTDYEIYINVYNALLFKSADELDSVYYNNSLYFHQEMIEVYHKKNTFNHLYEFELPKPCESVYVHVILFADFQYGPATYSFLPMIPVNIPFNTTPLIALHCTFGGIALFVFIIMRAFVKTNN